MKKILLVSNRLPFHITESNEQLAFTPSSGGLVTSIKSYLEKNKSKDAHTTKWMGTADMEEEIFLKYSSNGLVQYDDFILNPVFLNKRVRDKFYNGFCNNTIWPLFHYFPSYTKYNEEHWQEYIHVNKLFCEKIVAEYSNEDLIWIHDYHLMLLPALLREKLPHANIGFFLHIPFPSFEVFRMLPDPWRKGILTGLLGADLIGFHTNSYVQYFLQSVQQLLGFDNSLRVITTNERTITADTFPISIDYEKWNKAFDEPAVYEEKNKIKKRFTDTKIILSVDRLDYTKGILNRLKGYEVFLKNNPDYHHKVVYILVLVPSREAVPRYAENKKETEETISRINGKFGNIDWTPVVYQYHSIPFDKLCALYTAADVALITPVRDGMNLVAKEFVATRKDKRGVLILSETAGASEELGEAILINPTDINELSDAIKRALNMNVEEQTERIVEMQKRLQNYEVVRWAGDFIAQLLQVKEKQKLMHVKEVSFSIEQEIISQYTQSKSRILFLDYDGTLVPFAKLPHLAAPDNNVFSLLSNLTNDSCNHICVISGRDRDTLEKWFGKLPVTLIAEHGSYIKLKGEKWDTHQDTTTNWKATIVSVMNTYMRRCAGSFVEEKSSSVAWHYRNSEKELGFLRSRELINVLSELVGHFNFQILEGQKVVEARTRGIDKGVATSSLLSQDHYDFILSIGDDKTDEDMFKALPEKSYSIKVGLLPSVAKYNLIRQKNVIPFLNRIVGSVKK